MDSCRVGRPNKVVILLPHTRPFVDTKEKLNLRFCKQQQLVTVSPLPAQLYWGFLPMNGLRWITE